MNIQYYFSRGLTIAFYSVGLLLSEESLAGLIVNSIDSKASARVRLFYDPIPEDGTARGRAFYQSGDNDEKHSTNLFTQPVDLSVYEAVNNFADAPLSDRYDLAGSGLATASYTDSGELSVFHSLVELDFGPIEAPDNPDYDTQDDEPYMFFVGGNGFSVVRFNFSIDTPHEYTLSYTFESDRGKNNNAQPLIRFESDQSEIIYEENGFFFSGERTNSISGFLDPGNYFILNDMLEQHSMEFGFPLDFGTPTTSSMTLSLKDSGLDDSGSHIPVPTSVLLLLTGISLLRFRGSWGR